MIDEFADLPHGRGGTLGEAAEQDLFALQHLVMGAIAPETSGTDLVSETMSLADFRGKVVVLSFWGSWCGPCIDELPTLKADSEEFEQVEVLGVMSDGPTAAIAAVARHNVTIRNWGHGRRGQIARQWNIDSWPVTYVLDPQGVIRHKELESDHLPDVIWALIQEKSPQR